ncbi:MAG: hypothetical protein KAK02_08975 [Desulfobulbaceae bacterium]|nr:hypothetical protein [Desulfobulbaceae bacterium]
MKIYDIPGQKGPVKSSTGSEKPTGIDFQKLLDDRLHNVSEGKKVAAADPTTPATSVSTSLRLESLALTETAIGTLDSYRAALGNTAIAPEALTPFVDALEEETAGLLNMKGQLPEDDALAHLLERVATVSYLETAKFRRGDFSA